jgi:hypothetical protein
LLFPMAVLGAYVFLKWFIAHDPRFEADWRPGAFFWMNGADQLTTFGARYVTLSRFALAWGILCFLPLFAAAVRTGKREATRFRLPIELYLVALTAAAFVPENIHSDFFAGWIGLLVSRLTSITAIFGLCVLGLFPLRKWQVAVFAVFALIFFVWTYRDTATISQLEANANALIEALPYGTRIVPVVSAPDGWRVQFIAHSVERACIGHCFSYSNYEPSTGQFRVRVRAGSPIATDDSEKAEAMASGDYVVKQEDLPLVSIFQCDDADWTKLCAEPLWAGNKTEAPQPPEESTQKRK